MVTPLLLNALVVGYGSIGRRHVENLLREESVGKIVVCSGHGGGDTGDSRLLFRTTLEDALAAGPVDMAIVANDTSRHVETACFLARAGIPLCIEKPVSMTPESAASLEEIVSKLEIPVLVAYNMRFLGIFRRLQELIEQGGIGSRYFARIEVGQYLPSWRPAADYRNSYSADASRGGGVRLDLSHELDYMRHLFGMPRKWKVSSTRVSRLEIDSDDLFEGVYEYADGFVCSVHLDYLQKEKRRGVRIVGSSGVVDLDLVACRMTVTTEHGEKVFADTSLFDMNGTYRDELRHFIRCVTGDEVPLLPLKGGIEVLKLLRDGDYVP